MKLAKYFGIGAAGIAVTLGSVGVAKAGRETLPMPAPSLAENAYKVDGVHSSLVFRIKHNNVAYFYGRFNKIEGSFSLDEKDAGTNSVEVTVATDSVDTGNEGRDKHLKSQDFFSASEFPSITFKSKAWKPTGKDGDEQMFDVVGDLTLLGQTREVVVPVRHTGNGTGRGGTQLAGLEAKFTIKRSDFGMSHMVGRGLGDEVTIVIGLEGGRK